jgi:hypothetical protein
MKKVSAPSLSIIVELLSELVLYLSKVCWALGMETYPNKKEKLKTHASWNIMTSERYYITRKHHTTFMIETCNGMHAKQWVTCVNIEGNYDSFVQIPSVIELGEQSIGSQP